MDKVIPMREAVLNSINGIDNVCAISEACLFNTLEAINEKEYQKTVIQESKIGDWFEAKDDESVLKTIFLAIPRLIIRIVKLIKQAWMDFQYEKKVKTRLNRFNELEEEYNRYLAEYDRMMPDKIFQSKAQGMPNTLVTTDPPQVVYFSKIKDFEKLAKFYADILDFCNKYKDTVENMDEHFSFVRELNTMISDVDKLITPDNQRVPINLINPTDQSNVDLRASLEGLIKEGKNTLNSIQAVMTRVEGMYSRAVAKDEAIKIPRDSISIMRDDITNLMNAFMNVDTDFRKDINEFISVIDRWNAIMIEGIDEYTQNRREKFKKALDDIKKEREEEEKAYTDAEEAFNKKYPNYDPENNVLDMFKRDNKEEGD